MHRFGELCPGFATAYMKQSWQYIGRRAVCMLAVYKIFMRVFFGSRARQWVCIGLSYKAYTCTSEEVTQRNCYVASAASSDWALQFFWPHRRHAMDRCEPSLYFFYLVFCIFPFLCCTAFTYARLLRF